MLKREIAELKEALAKSSATLASYQLARGSSPVVASSNEFISKFVKKTPEWIADVSYLSPLVQAYEVCSLSKRNSLH